MRRARLRRACLVAVSSSRGAAGRRNAAHLATWAAVVRPRSWSRRSTGALTMRALSSLIAAVARRLGASAGGFQRSQRLAAAPGARNGEV